MLTTMTAKFELTYFATADELARTVAGQWLEEIIAASQVDRQHCVAVSGGRIANTFFKEAAEQAQKRGVSFNHVHFFWADERSVPPENPESNYKIAKELLFAPMNVPEAQIHRVRGELSSEAAAFEAESEIKRIVPLQDDQPVLDLILLGLGEDGHTASLFPGEREESAGSRAVYRPVHDSPKPPPDRVTLGYPAITVAREAWMLASGTGKEAALRNSLSTNGKTPFARVLKLRNHTRIFTDLAV